MHKAGARLIVNSNLGYLVSSNVLWYLESQKSARVICAILCNKGGKHLSSRFGSGLEVSKNLKQGVMENGSSG